MPSVVAWHRRGRRPTKRTPRFIRPYPRRPRTGIRRFKGGSIKWEHLRQKRPRRHSRAAWGTRTRIDVQAALEQRAVQGLDGSLEERIVYAALVDHGLRPGVDFDFQSAEFGGRAVLGGLVADFLFEVPRLIIQVQSVWHVMSKEIIQRDSDQSAILQSIGYTVLELWPETIHSQAALDLWMTNNLGRLWGTSYSPLVSGAERGDFEERNHMYDDLVRRVENLETLVTGNASRDAAIGQRIGVVEQTRMQMDDNMDSRIGVIERALFSPGSAGPALRITSASIANILQSTNYSSTTGWRIEKDGDAFFNDLTARGTMQSDNYVSGSEGWIIDEDGNAEFHDVTVRGQIVAATFKYDAVSTIGGAMMIGPASNIAADVTAVATTVTVVDAQFVNGDFLYVKVGGTYEVMEVTAGGGTTSLTVTRGVDGTATAWKKGTAIVRKGDRILLDTVAANSPYLDIIDHTGPLYSDEDVKVRLGNLAGISDPYMTPAGYGLYSDNVFLSGTAVFASGTVTLDSNGVTILSGLNDSNFVKWQDSGETTGYVTSYETVANDRGLTILAIPYELGNPTDTATVIGVASLGGSPPEAGSPAITLKGVQGSVDLNATYIDFASDKSGAGGMSMRMTREALKIYGDVRLSSGYKIWLDTDLDTGLSSPSDDYIAVLIGGSEEMTLKSTYFDLATPVINLTDSSPAIVGSGSNHPEIGSTTDSEKWGTIYMAVGKDVHPLDDEVGTGTRLDGLVSWDEHFDNISALPSGWTWAGVPFVTPTVSYGSGRLTLLYTVGAARSFLYKAHDGTTDTSVYQVLLSTNSNNTASYGGVRVDDGGDNNYAEAVIKIASTPTWTFDAVYNLGGAGRTITTGSTFYHPMALFTLNCFNTRWSSWAINAQVSGLSTAGLWQIRSATVNPPLTWTPARQGFIINWTGASWHRWYLDAFKGD